MVSAAFFLMSLGCLPDIGHPAPADAVLTVSSLADGIAWSTAYNGLEDGIGILAPVDALVVDGDGRPLPYIQLEVISGYGGVYLLPEAAIQEVDPPNPETAGSNCDPKAAEYDVENCPWYDESSEVYFELSSAYDGYYKPNYLLMATDNRGIGRFWMYIDSMPQSDEGSWVDVSVSVGTGYQSELVPIVVAD
jgi:hypothetical protein